MPTTLFEKFIPTIRSLTPAELGGGASLFEKLRIAKTDQVEVCYAPFEHVNPMARLVIVGITPGKTQMLNALREARRQLDAGAEPMHALIAAKQTGAFSGPMRPNLVAMLDHIDLPRKLGLRSASDLFGVATGIVQTASVLQNPVFLADGRNYNGTPDMTRNAALQTQLTEGFGRSLASLKHSYFLPLGPKVSKALMFLESKGLLDGKKVLHGMPHPSPASAERINYFLGRKDRNKLSIKTNAEILDAGREGLIRKVAAIS